MTIEERAEKARLLYFGYLPKDIGVTYKDGYVQGATEQKAITKKEMIKKACEWLKENIGKDIYWGRDDEGSFLCDDELLADFETEMNKLLEE